MSSKVDIMAEIDPYLCHITDFIAYVCSSMYILQLTKYNYNILSDIHSWVILYINVFIYNKVNTLLTNHQCDAFEWKSWIKRRDTAILLARKFNDEGKRQVLATSVAALHCKQLSTVHSLRVIRVMLWKLWMWAEESIIEVIRQFFTRNEDNHRGTW